MKEKQRLVRENFGVFADDVFKTFEEEVPELLAPHSELFDRDLFVCFARELLFSQSERLRCEGVEQVDNTPQFVFAFLPLLTKNEMLNSFQ